VSKFLVSDAVLQAFYDAGLLEDPSSTRRVIIDLEVGKPAKIYFEKFADDVLLDLIRDGHLRFVDNEDLAGTIGPLKLRPEDSA
jgi:hypothetical protein